MKPMQPLAALAMLLITNPAVADGGGDDGNIVIDCKGAYYCAPYVDNSTNIHIHETWEKNLVVFVLSATPEATIEMPNQQQLFRGKLSSVPQPPPDEAYDAVCGLKDPNRVCLDDCDNPNPNLDPNRVTDCP